MAKEGNRLGKQPWKPPAELATNPKASTQQMDALSAVLRALLPLSPLAQTRVIAAAAEYYGLSLTVEN